MKNLNNRTNKKKYKGIWFFGLSGVGKTTASEILKKKKKNILIIDGDQVRKKISTDLGYTVQDRKIQLKRLLGLARIAIDSNIYPIVSCVLMNRKAQKQIVRFGIRLIRIERSYSEAQKKNKVYKSTKNVVGKDIKQEKINCENIFNKSDKKYFEKIKKLMN